MTKHANRGNLPAAIFLFCLLFLWQLGAMKVNAAYILPTPIQILQRLWELRVPLFTVHLPATMAVTGIGLLISVLLSFLLSKTMVGPIEKLTAGAERVASGDFSSELPVESTDEIGILTGTFNEMAGVLQSTLAAMENERNKLDTLFLHMTDGVVAFDHRGKLIHCNPAANTMLQRTVTEECTYDELFGHIYPFDQMLTLQRPNYAEGEMVVGDRTLELYLAPFSDQASGWLVHT